MPSNKQRDKLTVPPKWQNRFLFFFFCSFCPRHFVESFQQKCERMNIRVNGGKCVRGMKESERKGSDNTGHTVRTTQMNGFSLKSVDMRKAGVSVTSPDDRTSSIPQGIRRVITDRVSCITRPIWNRCANTIGCWWCWVFRALETLDCGLFASLSSIPALVWANRMCACT